MDARPATALTGLKRVCEKPLEVTVERATVAHEEHGPITLPRGSYRVWRQREYSPEAVRPVRD